MAYAHTIRQLLDEFGSDYNPLYSAPTWTNQSTGDYLKSASGVATNVASGGVDRIAVLSNTYPATADISVEANLSSYNAADFVLAGIAARVAEPGTDTYYWADIGSGGVLLRLFSRVAGAAVQLGALNLGVTSGLVRLECVGTAIKVYLDSVEKISVTNSAISSAGRAALRFYVRTNTANLATADNFAIYTDTVLPATDFTASNGTSSVHAALSWTASLTSSVSYRVLRTEHGLTVTGDGDFGGGEGTASGEYLTQETQIQGEDWYERSDGAYIYWSGVTDWYWRSPANALCFSRTNASVIGDFTATGTGSGTPTTAYTTPNDEITDGLSATTYNDTTAVVNTRYLYAVVAYIGAVDSALSNVDEGYRTLLTVENFAATDGTEAGQVTMTWDTLAYTSATVTIKRSIAGAGSYTTLQTGIAYDTDTYTDTTPAQNVDYDYQAIAILEAIESQPAEDSGYSQRSTNPSASDFVRGALYNGKYSYYSATVMYYFWWDTSSTKWICSRTLGSGTGAGEYWWNKTDLALDAGTWIGQNESSGTDYPANRAA